MTGWKALIAGATGAIGGALADHLTGSKSWEILGLCRRPSARPNPGVDYIHVEGGLLTIETHGQLQKLVDRVAQITLSGRQAMIQGQEILYVTERAVFRLTDGELRLEETAPGVDPRQDVLERMAFQPVVADDLESMPEAGFQP